MTYREIENKIAYLDTDTILAACKDIYNWRKDGLSGIYDCGVYKNL